MGTTPSNLDAESIPIDGTKLMKRNFVSRVMRTQMDLDSSSDICIIKGTSSVGNDHRCGAYQNNSNAKVRIELLNEYKIARNGQSSLSFLGLYFPYLFMAMWRALYTLPSVLAVVVLMSPLGNASSFVKEF